MAEYSLPPWEILHKAVLSEDFLAPGDRLRPTHRTEERIRRGRTEAAYPRAHYAVAEGDLLVVTTAGGRAVQRALQVRDGVPMPIAQADAEDLLDPDGARRRAWRRRVAGTLL